MSVLIEDSPRSFLVEWIATAVRNGTARGTVITPWATPWLHHDGAGRKHRAEERAEEFRANNVEVWFDPMTHALQIGGVGDFRYYNEYDLWAGARGDLSAPELREGHVGKVFDVQDALGTSHLAPTVLLHAGLDSNSALAFDLAKEAIRRDPTCWLSIAGTVPFWESGAALDAHIGALASLQPAGWFLSVVRTSTTTPVSVGPVEAHGLCRSARALSEDVPVHISHGDLAGLPAIAGGATTLGSGWDQRQRMCSYDDYDAREPAGSGGGWFKRPTLQVLLGVVSANEATILETRDAALVTRLGGLPAPGVREVFDHHLAVLSSVIQDIESQPDFERRYRRLLTLYANARAEWPGVQRHTGSPIGAREWINGVAGGLELYGRTEGW